MSYVSDLELIQELNDTTPVFARDFSAVPVLNPDINNEITFTRSTTATRYNASGTLETMAIDAPRFDYDPITKACKGLLIEESRTNLITYSGDASSHWGATNVTRATSVVDLAPDGVSYMQVLSETTASGQHAITAFGGASNASTPVIAGTVYTVSVYLKKVSGSVDWMQLTVSAASSRLANGYVNVNLSTGTLGTYGSLTGTPTIVGVGNGIWRVTFSVLATGAGGSGNTNTLAIGFNNNSSSATRLPSYVGNTNNKVNFWGAQFEASAFSSSYVATTSAAVTRGADNCSVTGTNFSRWYRQNEGTLHVEGNAPVTVSGDSTLRGVACISESSGFLNRLLIGFRRTNFSVGTVVENNVAAFALSNALTVPGNFNLAMGYKTGNSAVSTNGSILESSSAITTPTRERLLIGYGDSGQHLVYITKIYYYPKRLPNRLLKAITL